MEDIPDKCRSANWSHQSPASVVAIAVVVAAAAAVAVCVFVCVCVCVRITFNGGSTVPQQEEPFLFDRWKVPLLHLFDDLGAPIHA